MRIIVTIDGGQVEAIGRRNNRARIVYSAAGASVAEAIGALLLRHGDSLGVEIAVTDVPPCPPASPAVSAAGNEPYVEGSGGVFE